MKYVLILIVFCLIHLVQPAYANSINLSATSTLLSGTCGTNSIRASAYISNREYNGAPIYININVGDGQSMRKTFGRRNQTGNITGVYSVDVDESTTATLQVFNDGEFSNIATVNLSYRESCIIPKTPLGFQASEGCYVNTWVDWQPSKSAT